MNGERDIDAATKGPVASHAADLSASAVDFSPRRSVPPPVHGGGALPRTPIVPLTMPKSPPAMRLRFPGPAWRSRS
jgi:hypothetical protein